MSEFHDTRTGGYSPPVSKPESALIDFAVDRSSPVPLYYQLAQQLEGAIEHGRLSPGSLLGNEIDAALGSAEGSDVVVLERLRSTYGEPMAYMTNYLPTDLLDLDTDKLEATGLYRLLRGAGVTLHSAQQAIGARTATAEESEL